jgi:hypothetical protein
MPKIASPNSNTNRDSTLVIDEEEFRMRVNDGVDWTSVIEILEHNGGRSGGLVVGLIKNMAEAEAFYADPETFMMNRAFCAAAFV